MNGHDLENAMEFVSPELLDLAEHRSFRPSPWQKFGTIAAALALLAGLGATIWLYGMPATKTPELSQPEIQKEIHEAVPEEVLAEEPAETPVEELLPSDALVTHDITQLLDPASLEAHLQAHPELQVDQLKINEAGLDQNGTELKTIQGDPVLAIDSANQLMLVRMQGPAYRGVLAICKDPTRLHLKPSAGLGEYGQTVGEIAQANGGILAINASGFLDSSGSYVTYEGEYQPGGTISQETIPLPDELRYFGIPLCNAVYDGVPYTDSPVQPPQPGMPFSRLEISEDGLFRLTPPDGEFREDTQSAVTSYPFKPMVAEGQVQTENLEGFGSVNARTCIGQAADGSVLLLVIEGRLPDRSLGLPLADCAELLLAYDCQTAISLTHGSCSLMWYEGAPVTACSNSSLPPDGRPVPDAFVIS